MQQTEKYKLNLIESSDPFLPDALNANTQRLEEVVSGHLEDMDQRVTVLEGFHFACGVAEWDRSSSYTVTVKLPFTPAAVLLVNSHNDGSAMLQVNAPGCEQNRITLIQDGFQVLCGGQDMTTAPFGYLAFG